MSKSKYCEDEGCPHCGTKHTCINPLKIPEDLRPEYEEMRNRKKHGVFLTSMEEKVYVLTERIAALEAPASDELIHEFYSSECEAGVSFDFLRRFQAFIVTHAQRGSI